MTLLLTATGALWLAAAPCTPAETVTLALKEGATVESVAAWAGKQLCVTVTVDPSAKGAKLAVGLSGRVGAAEVFALLTASAQASGLSFTSDATGWVFAKQPTASPADKACRDAAAAIRVVSDTERAVSRKAFESDWEGCTVNAARVVPSMEGGELSGLRLFSIRAPSVWAAAGFLNGDVLRAVNGLPLLEPNDVLTAREKLRKADRLDFLVKRRDALVHVVIRVDP